MESAKLKTNKQLRLIDLTDLFFEAGLAVKYAEKLEAKIESFGYCQKWAKKIENCSKSILLVKQEMCDLLEKEGAFREIGG
jgi:hypothetical protein